MKIFFKILVIISSMFIISCGGGGGQDFPDNYPPCNWFAADEVGHDSIPVFNSKDPIHTYCPATEYYYDIFIDGFISDTVDWNTNPHCEHGDKTIWGFRFAAYKLSNDQTRYLDGSFVPDIVVQIDGMQYTCQIIEDPDDPGNPNYYTGVLVIPIAYNTNMLYALDPFEQLFHKVEKIFVDGVEVNLTTRNY
jgi:hypothetical protein